MGGFVKFLSYNNAVPIAISFMLMGAGGVFAATNPEAIYSEEESVVSIDNTYVAYKDFESWTPRIVIDGVTEDEENYYVAYHLLTIDIIDHVWQDTTKSRTLTVAKALLSETIDLGIYTTRQLKEVVDAEHALLKETQQFERRAITQKTIVTEYHGLVGTLLDTSTEALPVYEPVVVVPTPAPEAQIAAVSVVPNENTEPNDVPPQSGDGGAAEEGPSVQLLGDNPARVATGGSYTDLGVVIEVRHEPYTLKLFVNDEEVSSVAIDTTQSGEWRVRYQVTDAEGIVASVERRVTVFAPSPPSGSASSTPPTTATSTQETEPGDPPAASSTPSETPVPQEPEPQPSAPTTETTPPEEPPAENPQATE